jgi:PAS domain S-box-containing protein
VNWSSKWSDITGVPARELEGEGVRRTVHPDDAPRTWERWREALANGTSYEDEVRVRVANGRYRWFAVSASPVRDRGRIIEWVGIFADIHDRKRHEENAAFLNRASVLLSSTLASEEAMRNLARLCVPALGDWCAIHIGHDENYQRLVAEHSDPARMALVERFDAHARPAPENDAIVQVLKTGKSQLVSWASDEALREMMPADQYELVRGLGLHSWIVAPMVAHGRTLGALTVVCGDSGRRYSEEDVPLIEDLARRAAIALDNARLFEQAEAANRAKDEFLATLSHELRTPLTAIAGWAHMLESGIADEETRNLAIDTIVRSARTQGELIDDLLDLSRVVAGTLHLQVAALDLGGLVDEVLVAARPAADAKNLALSLSRPPQRVIVKGDERRLRQIAWNLVTNAVKFTDQGGSVVVTVSATATMARLEVQDTGRGIAPEFIPHVWDRFRQADSSTSRQHGGLGLGLAVVRHLVEMHGGTVHAQSPGLGAGSTFRVEIPLAREAETRSAPLAQSAGEGESLRGRRILLVDDDDDARLVLAAMLSWHGAAVTPVASVTAALPLLEAGPFDAIVSDIAMPGEDGYALPGRARIPAIAVSAIATGPEDRRRALDAGFRDFLRKPVDAMELLEALLRVLP